ncbi:MAG: transglycosylase SLT domain-containing protein [Methylophilus sp.]
MSKLFSTLSKTRQYLLILLVLCCLPVAYADSGDDEFIFAKSAYDSKNSAALADSLSRLQSQHNILAPYADYWLLMLNWDNADEQTIKSFITRYSQYPFANNVRGEWLKKLGSVQNWPIFIEQYSLYTKRDDVAVNCYAVEADASIYGLAPLENAKNLWFQDKDLPANCDNVFDKMQAAKILTSNDIVKRFRMALYKNKIGLANSIVQRADVDSNRVNKWLSLAYANPQKLIDQNLSSSSNRYGKEVYLYALDRLARKDSAIALSEFKSLAGIFNAEETAYFYAALGLQAAKRQEPAALNWFQLAQNNTELNEEQFDWYARSALRQTNWTKLLEITKLMPEEQQQDATWRYWKGRALKASNQESEANQIFAALSTERHYYGWLAQEELVSSMGLPTEIYEPTKEAIAVIASMSAVKRALALQRLDFRWEAKMEWNMATTGLTDNELIAASAYAAKQNWFDIVVETADRTKQTHNFALRYPTPYRNLMKPSAMLQNIDEAWVYGIIRQESRFMHYAKSNVGAAGLMQVMPATAKWIAQKMGWADYHNGMIHELDTNVSLGTYYLGYTLNQFKGQETMATAAYNAGPGRAKRWADESRPLEGAIYAETIPFDETRNYVKRVLANAHLYAPQLGLKPTTLKARLGVVPAKN